MTIFVKRNMSTKEVFPQHVESLEIVVRLLRLFLIFTVTDLAAHVVEFLLARLGAVLLRRAVSRVAAERRLGTKYRLVLFTLT